MKKKIVNVWSVVLGGAVMFLVAGLVFILCLTVVQDVSTKEIESYTEGFEISNTDYSIHHIKNGGVKKTYTMEVINDTDAHTFYVDAKTWAKYKEGDIVEVKVAIMKSNVMGEFKTYELIE